MIKDTPLLSSPGHMDVRESRRERDVDPYPGDEQVQFAAAGRSHYSTGVAHPPFALPSSLDHHEYDPPNLDEDHELDDFDKQLLAERPQERAWQAAQGLARISLPPKSLRTPVNANASRSRIEDDRHDSGIRCHPSSSSPAAPVSSPTVRVLNQRQLHHRSGASGSGVPNVQSRPQSLIISPAPSGQASQRRERRPTSTIELGHAPPVIQGIHLVSTHDLPDRFRSVFPYPVFNAVQSECFFTAFKTNDNLVLSAPTGSGKTVTMELAICQIMSDLQNEQYKVVYQAPTKSLCSERFRDWQAKFGSLGLQCAELTGDTDHNQLRSVQSANIIITTPEKWDSVTRKWKDHEKLMELVKLFLIDEVHILKESRGATLEAVVSRMKSTGSNVRFIALSATIPNSEDIAAWLGKNSQSQHLPAHREIFGEEFRPVRLQKFVFGYASRQNDWGFDRTLDEKLPAIIAEYSDKRPIIIFCCTRNIAIQTAKRLANSWTSTRASDRLWRGLNKPAQPVDQDLRQTVSAGVAFHHGGMDLVDRRTIEQYFLEGHISIICCTSTLAVGVNLPCYLVIIKNTVTWTDNGIKEYTDLEMMQMLGRAGRPQFESSACAVILTRQERVEHYQKMVSGQEVLESCLHLNLIDHLNAEIGLGTVYDIRSAKTWLAGTFLFVRLSKNPNHYKLKEDVHCQDKDHLLEQICDKDIKLLREVGLISDDDKLRSTDFGDAMARYCIKYDTMKIILSLPPKSKMSEILSVLAQAAEFREVRLKAGEKSVYKDLNRDVMIKYPIKVDIALAAHKISLLIQAELGDVGFPSNEAYKKHQQQYQQDKSLVFQHINRLIRCVIDCQLHLQDSVSTRHALELARSLGARVWDNSAMQLRQLDQIGKVAVRKLTSAGINSIETLENTEAHRIEAVLGKNPPFGMKVLTTASHFPKLWVSVKKLGQEAVPGKWVKVKIKAEIGFLNEKVPMYFNRKPVYVCFLAETSDGRVIDFRRIGANRLQNGQDILFAVDLQAPTPSMTCSVMCDEIAGSSRHAELKWDLPASFFPAVGRTGQNTKPTRRTGVAPPKHPSNRNNQIVNKTDEFGDGELDDGDLLAAEKADDTIEVLDIDDLDIASGASSLMKRRTKRHTRNHQKSNESEDDQDEDRPVQLENGRWACNHSVPCRKDGKECKHKCCHEGIEKPRKLRRRKSTQQDDGSESSSEPCRRKEKKAKLASENARARLESSSEVNRPMDRNSTVSAGKSRTSLQGKKHLHLQPVAQEPRSLQELHKAIGNSTTVFKPAKKPVHEYENGTVPQLSFLQSPYGLSNNLETGLTQELDLDDLPETEALLGEDVAPIGEPHNCEPAIHRTGKSGDENFGCLDDASFGLQDGDLTELDAALVGLDDSLELEQDHHKREDSMTAADTNVSPWADKEPRFNSMKNKRAMTSDFFDDDDLGGHFPPHHMRMEDVDLLNRWESVPRLSKHDPLVSPESSDRCRSPISASNKRPKIHSDVSEDIHEVHASTLHKREEPDIEMPNINTGLRLPILSSHLPEKAGAVKYDAGQHTVDQKKAAADNHIEKQAEEEEKKKWEGLDPSFYEQFKDFVEFI